MQSAYSRSSAVPRTAEPRSLWRVHPFPSRGDCHGPGQSTAVSAQASRTAELRESRSRSSAFLEVPSDGVPAPPGRTTGGDSLPSRADDQLPHPDSASHRRAAPVDDHAYMAKFSGSAEFPGFAGFELVVRSLGGIASRRELLRISSLSETDFWFALYYRHLDRIRQGWYAASDLPADARAAWKAGGPLACVSALRHYGMLDSGPAGGDDALHICLPAGGHVARGAPAGIVVHWSTADRSSGSRRAVSPAVALRQARACRHRGGLA